MASICLIDFLKKYEYLTNGGDEMCCYRNCTRAPVPTTGWNALEFFGPSPACEKHQPIWKDAFLVGTFFEGLINANGNTVQMMLLFINMLARASTDELNTILYIVIPPKSKSKFRRVTAELFFENCMNVYSEFLASDRKEQKEYNLIQYEKMPETKGFAIPECIVCYGEESIVITRCNHTVCYACLKRVKFSCPYRCGKSNASQCKRFVSLVEIVEDD